MPANPSQFELLSGEPRRRHAWQDNLDFRSPAGLAIEIEPAAQTIRHDGVDHMKAETGAASIATGREKWVERLSPDIETHAAAVVGEQNFDMVISRRLDLDVDGTRLVIGERVRNGVEEEVGQHL